jgi:hypothetical protein
LKIYPTPPDGFIGFTRPGSPCLEFHGLGGNMLYKKHHVLLIASFALMLSTSASMAREAKENDSDVNYSEDKIPR